MRKLLTIIAIYTMFYGVGLLYMAYEKGVFDKFEYLLDDYSWLFIIM